MIRGHRSSKRYVCVVKAVDQNDIEIEYLRRQKPSYKIFAGLAAPDLCWTALKTVVNILSVPRLDRYERYEFPSDVEGTE